MFTTTCHEAITFSIEREDTLIGIDLYPHRAHPRAGVAKLDLLLGQVAAHFHTHRDFLIDDNGAFTSAWKTPMGRLDPGAMIVTRDAPRRENVVRVENGTLTMPDGTALGERQFRPVHALAPDLSDRQQDLLESLSGTTFNAMMAGHLLSCIDRGIDDSMKRQCAITTLALASRVVDFGLPAGLAGVERAGSEAARLFSQLEWRWFLEPDRAWGATRYKGSDALDALIAKCAPDVVSYGAAISNRLAEDVPKTLVQPLSHDAAQLSDSSAHEKLTYLGIRKKIKATIEDLAPLDILKPAARKRQEKRRRAA